MAVNLNDQIISYAVSSVLNKDIKQYGKKYLFDGEDDTCWNSDQVLIFIKKSYKKV